MLLVKRTRGSNKQENLSEKKQKLENSSVNTQQEQQIKQLTDAILEKAKQDTSYAMDVMETVLHAQVLWAVNQDFNIVKELLSGE